MTTLQNLLNSAKKEATIQTWGLAQRSVREIGYNGLKKVMAQLKETDPNFFKPKSMQ